MIEIGAHKVVIALNPQTNLFRGELIDLDGGVDFYAADLKTLQRDDEIVNKLNRRAAFRDSHPHQGKSLEAIAQSLCVRL